MIDLFDSENLIASAIALATTNALLNLPNQQYLTGPALDQIKFEAEDSVGMIGNFTPLVTAIQPQVRQLNIFERQANPEQHVMSIDLVENILPNCQVALITATAIINGSIDYLLELTKSCREVVILGSSTPLSQDLFRDTPVTLLSGITVRDSGEIMRIVSEGGGTPAFKQTVDKVNLAIA